MIYDYPGAAAPIRQGDIFFDLPRIELSLRRVLVADEEGETFQKTWKEITRTQKEVTAVLALRPVPAIVATQDCDTVHAPDITLCEIRPFRDVERKAAQTSSAKSWKNIITQHARVNQKWFYLPPDDQLGFTDKMAVDFMITLRLRRVELEDLRDMRRGRLNGVADEHFRERIAEFFRRYPYDEWYPLNEEELRAYRNEYPDVPFFTRQAIGSEQEGQKR